MVKKLRVYTSNVGLNVKYIKKEILSENILNRVSGNILIIIVIYHFVFNNILCLITYIKALLSIVF